MKLKVWNNSEEIGREAAALSAKILNDRIAVAGSARLLLSTGASQFETLKALVSMKIDWSKVEMFHLDEYVALSDQHPASFRKYLRERFTDLIPLRRVHYVNGEGSIQDNIRYLTTEIRRAPIDLALVGIGENAHIAFNDPPANFDTKEAYIVVDLDDDCKEQQVGEGWFATTRDVPNQAISMTVYQIMQSRAIISCVPHKIKANAIRKFISSKVTNLVPATILKTHPNFLLYLDKHSASGIDSSLVSEHLEEN